MNAPRGFTLLEVLVALALVASALGGSLMVMRGSIAAESHLEQRTLAEWVATNALNQFLLENPRPTPQTLQGREQALGQDFAFAIAVRPRRAAADEAPGVEASVTVTSGTANGPALAGFVRDIDIGPPPGAPAPSADDAARDGAAPRQP